MRSSKSTSPPPPPLSEVLVSGKVVLGTGGRSRLGGSTGPPGGKPGGCTPTCGPVGCRGKVKVHRAGPHHLCTSSYIGQVGVGCGRWSSVGRGNCTILCGERGDTELRPLYVCCCRIELTPGGMDAGGPLGGGTCWVGGGRWEEGGGA